MIRLLRRVRHRISLSVFFSLAVISLYSPTYAQGDSFWASVRVERIVVDVPDIGLTRVYRKDRSLAYSDDRIVKDLEAALWKDFGSLGKGSIPVELNVRLNILSIPQMKKARNIGARSMMAAFKVTVLQISEQSKLTQLRGVRKFGATTNCLELDGRKLPLPHEDVAVEYEELLSGFSCALRKALQ